MEDGILDVCAAGLVPARGRGLQRRADRARLRARAALGRLAQVALVDRLRPDLAAPGRSRRTAPGSSPRRSGSTTTAPGSAPPQMMQASVDRSAFYQQMVTLFDRFDFLALPTAQVWPFPVEWRWPKEIAGRTMDTYHRWMEVVAPATFAGLPVRQRAGRLQRRRPADGHAADRPAARRHEAAAPGARLRTGRGRRARGPARASDAGARPRGGRYHRRSMSTPRPHSRPAPAAFARADAGARRGARGDDAAADRPRRSARAGPGRRLRIGDEGAAADRARRGLLLRRQRPRRLGGGDRQPGRRRHLDPDSRHRPLLRRLGRAGGRVRRPGAAHALCRRACRSIRPRWRRRCATTARTASPRCSSSTPTPPAAPPRTSRRCAGRSTRPAIRPCSSSTSSPRSRRRRSRWTRSASTSRSARRRRG